MRTEKRLIVFEKYIPEDTLWKIETTWEAGGLLVEGWTNILDHQNAVAALGVAMGMLISGKPSEVEDIAVACLIHDAFKRREVEAKKASQGDPRVLDEMASKQSAFLQMHGWPEHIVCATASVGHTSLERFYKQRMSICLLDKCAHLADSLTNDDTFPMLEVRIAGLRERYVKLQAEDPQRYGLPAGRTIFGMQEEVAFCLLAEFADCIGVQPRIFHEYCIRDANAILGRK